MSITPSTGRCAETRAHYAHEWYNPLRIYCPGGPDESLEVEREACRELNRRILKHESETPMRGHDEDGECCLRARLTPTTAEEDA